jgi:hypothetical protein
MSERFGGLTREQVRRLAEICLHDHLVAGDLLAALEKRERELAALKPTCAICGRAEPCEPSETACAFDPSPRALYERNRQLERELAEAKQARKSIKD